MLGRAVQHEARVRFAGDERLGQRAENVMGVEVTGVGILHRIQHARGVAQRSAEHARAMIGILGGPTLVRGDHALGIRPNSMGGPV